MYIVYNKDYHTPGRNIQLLRKKYALSCRALARLLNIDESYLKEIEAGENQPLFDHALFIRFAQIFPPLEGKDICSPDLFH